MSKFKFSIFLVIVLAISSNTYADSSLEDILGQCDDGVDSVEFLTCASTTDLSNDELHQCMEDHSIPEYMCPVGEEDDQKCEWIIKNCKKYKCIANYSDNLVFKSVKSSESINAEAFDLGSTIFGVAIYSALVKPAIQSMNKNVDAICFNVDYKTTEDVEIEINSPVIFFNPSNWTEHPLIYDYSGPDGQKVVIKQGPDYETNMQQMIADFKIAIEASLQAMTTETDEVKKEQLEKGKKFSLFLLEAMGVQVAIDDTQVSISYDEASIYDCGVSLVGENIYLAGVEVQGFDKGICTLKLTKDSMIADSVVTDNEVGLFMDGENNTAQDVELRGNGIGAIIAGRNIHLQRVRAVGNYLHGIQIKQGADVEINDSESSYNGGSGIYNEGEVLITGSEIINNGQYGIYSSDEGIARVDTTTIAGNVKGNIEGNVEEGDVNYECPDGYEEKDGVCRLNGCDTYDYIGECVEACPVGTEADDYDICRTGNKWPNMDLGIELNSDTGGCGCTMATSKTPIKDSLVLFSFFLIPLALVARKRFSY